MSTLPFSNVDHDNSTSPLSRHKHDKPFLSMLGGRPFLRWIGLIFTLLSVWWLFSPWTISSPSSIDFDWWNQKPFEPPTHLIWDARKEEVKSSFVHAWEGYMKQAFPSDEILPKSGKPMNKFNGWSVTVVDSLSTIWIMGLKKEFYEAVQSIERQKFTKSENTYIPFFETTIRYLGGYLSAYALSGERILLSLADDLAAMLLPAFNTGSGLPAAGVRPVTGETLIGSGLLAEVGSCQLEFKYLAKLTGRPEYYERVEYVMSHLYNATTYQNLFDEHWSISGGQPAGGRYTVGANTDSAYEYLLKQYLLVGDKRALNQYLKSIESVIKNLLYVSPTRNLLYTTFLDPWTNPPSPSHEHEHLVCYLPGLLALGAHILPDRLSKDPSISAEESQRMFSNETRQQHMWAAEGLAYTCWVLYADQTSGLSSDGAGFTRDGASRWVDALQMWKNGGAEGKPPGTRTPPPEREPAKRDYRNSQPERYLMRPETVESLYLLWKTTGDPVWRDRGYAIYQSIKKYTETRYGYGSVEFVDTQAPEITEDMPSYFLAETLKYLIRRRGSDRP